MGGDISTNEMRRLPVNLSELGSAMDDSDLEIDAYLDLETGEMIQITFEIESELRQTIDQMDTDDASDAAFERALATRKLQDWLSELVREARQVEIDYGTRFVEIPRTESRIAYQDMADFIETVDAPRVQDRLWSAIEGRGAFRRFRETIRRYPDLEQRWYTFSEAPSRERAIAWLRTEGIEPAKRADS